MRLKLRDNDLRVRGHVLVLQAAGGDAVDHLQVRLGAGEHDVGVQPAAAVGVPFVLDTTTTTPPARPRRR